MGSDRLFGRDGSLGDFQRGRMTLQVCDLHKAFEERTAIDDINFEVEPGERVMLVGLNGSGKTTLLRCIAGLLEITRGSVTVDGYVAGSIEARRAISFVPDSPVLYEDLSLIEHVEYVARMHSTVDWEARGAHLLAALGIEQLTDELPSTFSRGLRQKASIALGLIRPFRVLLVDEPFVGLDRPGWGALLKLLNASADQGAAVLVATHQDDFIDTADRCLGLRDGTLEYSGPVTRESIDRILEGS